MNEKVILGTVQFGLKYGINNIAGKPSEKEVFDILDTAVQNGIKYLDTADAYGDSISVIGNYHQNKKNRFKVLSKFKNVNKGELIVLAKASLNKLNISQFEVYSYHSFSDYINNHSVFDDLVKLKSLGLVKKTGISIYTNDEFERVIEDVDIDVIQIPYNLLDNYNLRGSLIEKAKQNGKELHVRSVFLQGLFFMDFERFPQKLYPLKSYLQFITDFCKSESISMQSLALSYVVANNNIDNVLVGVDNYTQLSKNLQSIQNNAKITEFINKTIFVKETELLNPVNWK